MGDGGSGLVCVCVCGGINKRGVECLLRREGMGPQAILSCHPSAFLIMHGKTAVIGVQLPGNFWLEMKAAREGLFSWPNL